MKCIILAGGYGKRLRPLTLLKPKPIVPIININNTLSYHIYKFLNLVKKQKNIYVLAGYKSDKILFFIRNKLMFENINIIIENEPLGTGGSIYNIKDEFKDDEIVIVVNGDIIHKILLDDFVKYFKHKKIDVLLATKEINCSSGQYGLILVDKNNKIYAFNEKMHHEGLGVISVGLYAFKGKFIKQYLYEKCSIEKVFEDNCIKLNFMSYKTDDYFNDIGTWPRYLKVQIDSYLNRF